jgi:hypothetical protein
MQRLAALIILLLSAALLLPAQEHDHAKQHEKEKKDRLAEVNRRGDVGMGFAQEKNRHRFSLTSRGGVIEVEAADPGDADNIALVQKHLAEAAKAFGRGDFSMPAFIHDQEVPGTATMKELKAQISYRTEKTPRGGRLHIRTSSAEALKAVHEFLRFQIADHQAGDKPHAH